MRYTAFVRSYYRWYNRMTDGDTSPSYMPCMFLSTLQAVNAGCALAMVPGLLPTWAFMTLIGCTVLVMYWRNRTIIDAIDEIPRFSRWTDNVPGVREFPLVYAYLLFTLCLIFLPIVVVNVAA